MPLLAIAALPFASTVPAIAQSPDADHTAAQTEAFDASAAWDEFEQLLRGKYAYIDRDDIDVEAQLDRSRALAAEAADEVELRSIFHRTALTFMDPHLIVGPFADTDYAIVMTAADLDAQFVAGRAVITDVRRGSPAFEAGIRPGDIIAEVDGAAPDLAARLPFGDVLPEPTVAQLDYGLMLAVNGKRAGSRHLKVISPDQQARAVELRSTRDWANSLRGREPVELEFVGKDRDIAILRPLNSLGNNETITAFDGALEKAIKAGAKALILDLRDTPSGGNTEVGRSIIGHFVTEVSPYQMHRIPALEREFTVPRQFVEYVFPRGPHYAGPVAVLHGRWTGSMGEGVVIGMDAAAPNAVTIGSDMGDLLGALWNFTLEKSHARVDLGGEAMFHVDGTPREDYVADIPVTPADSTPNGSDPAVAAALDYFASLAKN
ncbi:S41 family peptidase [Erythrobacter aureus]|uniref:PDZ domain-containing protein n=1 Tax=Erythrobacter aureus TaxID=2182384 RepID=A0A345YI78_9SPHN|nr:PDZ domain-containing protein [Erythrobacter aureus]AXK43630.1 hypothetical protein DVR09_12190 [Erythrobacter aureus]